MTQKPYLEAREEITRSSSVRFWFSRFATRAAQVVGHPYLFFTAVAVLVFWGLSGHYFHYSDTWQLVINTGTSVITFLVVFLIQNTQNRDAKAIHLKLDELIRSHHPASDELIDVEKLSDEELDALEKQYEKIRKETQARKVGREKNSVA
ncbi:MAG TPA: low affinity iron permease family protein [Candidatus Angelobacter sp.]|nr:low affinity iron permease family protein [Candidatus Angelobacter sp.]